LCPVRYQTRTRVFLHLVHVSRFLFPPSTLIDSEPLQKTVRWLQLLQLRNEIDFKHLWIPHIPQMLRQVLYFTDDSIDSQFWAIQAEHSTTFSPSKQQPISTSHSLILRRRRCSKCMQHHDADVSSSKSAAFYIHTRTSSQTSPGSSTDGEIRLPQLSIWNLQKSFRTWKRNLLENEAASLLQTRNSWPHTHTHTHTQKAGEESLCVRLLLSHRAQKWIKEKTLHQEEKNEIKMRENLADASAHQTSKKNKIVANEEKNCEENRTKTERHRHTRERERERERESASEGERKKYSSNKEFSSECFRRSIACSHLTLYLLTHLIIRSWWF
jgi:hypothetical protein